MKYGYYHFTSNTTGAHGIMLTRTDSNGSVDEIFIGYPKSQEAVEDMMEYGVEVFVKPYFDSAAAAGYMAPAVPRNMDAQWRHECITAYYRLALNSFVQVDAIRRHMREMRYTSEEIKIAEAEVFKNNPAHMNTEQLAVWKAANPNAVSL